MDAAGFHRRGRLRLDARREIEGGPGEAERRLPASAVSSTLASTGCRRLRDRPADQ